MTAGQVSSEGGALLLRQADRKVNLLSRVAACFTGPRSPVFVQHQLAEMLSQRIYRLALGYEDLNDHEQLRHDPLMGVLAGRCKLDQPLAGKSTLNWLELPGSGNAITSSTTRPARAGRGRRVAAKAGIPGKPGYLRNATSSRRTALQAGLTLFIPAQIDPREKRRLTAGFG